jgi:hypothetical protein
MAAVTLPGSAAATNIDQARAICSKNPNCNETDPGGGSFCIKGKTSNCEHAVDCPKNGGDCIVVWIQSGGGKKRLGSMGVMKALKSGATLTTKKPTRALGGGPDGNAQGLQRDRAMRTAPSGGLLRSGAAGGASGSPAMGRTIQHGAGAQTTSPPAATMQQR